jgi:hypothetical protein
VYEPEKVATNFRNLRRGKKKDVTHRIGRQPAWSLGAGTLLRIAVMQTPVLQVLSVV